MRARTIVAAIGLTAGLLIGGTQTASAECVTLHDGTQIMCDQPKSNDHRDQWFANKADRWNVTPLSEQPGDVFDQVGEVGDFFNGNSSHRYDDSGPKGKAVPDCILSCGFKGGSSSGTSKPKAKPGCPPGWTCIF